MNATKLIDDVAGEFSKYSKYITFATVVAATVVTGVVIYGMLKRKSI